MYIPLQCLTHGSPLLSQTTPKSLAAFCKKKGYNAVGLSDVNNLYMCVQYHEEMIKAGCKPLLGMQLQVYGGEEQGDINIYAKNLNGWKALLHILYIANSPENYKISARLEVFDFIKLITDDVIVVLKNKFVDIFEHHCNKPNIYIGLDPITYPKEIDVLRESTLQKVAVTPNHYLYKTDWHNNKILLANYFKGNIKSSTDKHSVFIRNNHYIMSEKDLLRLKLTQKEIDSTGEIYDKIERFDITYEQTLPNFACPDNMGQDEYLRELCRQGFKRLGLPKTPEYIDRIKMELDVIATAKMSGYFIIMQDIVNWARSQKILVGYGRGSAAGCLISYLTGIVNVDPIEYNLLFERFYSVDRKSVPDVDLDLPPLKRELIVKYIQDKYGADKFAQLSTFNTMKGAGALKAVLRAEGVEAQEQNYITKQIPDESKISPELQAQQDKEGTDSLLFWCINNMTEFKQWCNSKFEGIYGEIFRSSIELDKTISNRGRHASAFALSNGSIYNAAPLIWDPVAKRHIVGVNMDDAEKLGLIKLDLLGVDVLDKADFVRRGLQNGCF